jgi:membrane-associated phospholipid phosphatase
LETKLEKIDEPRWARIVSSIISPALIFPVLCFELLLHESADWKYIMLFWSIYTFFGFVLPIIMLIVLLLSRKISDIQTPRREERIGPFFLVVIFMIVGWTCLRLISAPPTIMLLATYTVLQSTVLMFITVYWQISVHASNITAAVIIATIYFGIPIGVLFSPLIPLVSIARLALKRHTLYQVLGGIFLSATLVLVTYIIGLHL